jgi:hypothetical protein
MKNIRMAVLLVMMAGLFVSGCRRDSERGNDLSATASRKDSSAMGRAVAEARGLLGQGRTHDAIRFLTASLDDVSEAAERAEVFKYCLVLLLESGQVTDAQQRYLAAVSSDQAMARSCFGIIERYLLNHGGGEALAGWCGLLLEQDLPVELLGMSYDYYLSALTDIGDRERLSSVAADCLSRCSDPVRGMIVRNAMRRLAYNNNGEAAEDIVELVRKMASADESLRGLERMLQVDLLLYGSKFGEAIESIRSSVEFLSDQAVASSLDQLAAGCTNEDDVLALAALCEFLLSNSPGKEISHGKAARTWVSTAVKRGNWAAVNSRLLELLRSDFSTEQIFLAYREAFYACAESGDEQSAREFVQIGKELYSRLGEQGQKRSAAMLIMDGCFILKDYDLALDVLDRGIPGEDEAWHAMLKSKVQAHKHQAEGRNREAAAGFRKFMDFVKGSDSEYQIDPMNQRKVSNWILLGLNARRIGELLATDGDEDGAQRAFEEARGYYLKALALVTDRSSAEFKEIEAALASVPARAELLK